MKNFYMLASAVLIAGSLCAQSSSITLPASADPGSSYIVPGTDRNTAPFEGGRASGQGYVDYSWYNQNNLSYVFPFNTNYTVADSNVKYAAVAMNKWLGFVDYDDEIEEWLYGTYPAGLTYTVDSLFALISHENNSGSVNHIVMQLVVLNGAGAPTTGSAVVWQDTISTSTSLSPSGNWVGTNVRYLAYWTPNYTAPVGQKLGMVLRYFAPTIDTMAILGSSKNDGSTTGPSSQAPFATSYVQYSYFTSIAANRTLTYSPGEYYRSQDWEMWPYVTFSDGVGIEENNMNAAILQNSPNPVVNGSTIIRYELQNAANVSLVFYDLTGKEVKVINDGRRAAGTYQLDANVSELAPGAYFYSLRTSEGTSLSKKMVITK